MLRYLTILAEVFLLALQQYISQSRTISIGAKWLYNFQDTTFEAVFNSRQGKACGTSLYQQWVARQI
jgi:hypothetical protein